MWRRTKKRNSLPLTILTKKIDVSNLVKLKKEQKLKAGYFSTIMKISSDCLKFSETQILNSIRGTKWWKEVLFQCKQHHFQIYYESKKTLHFLIIANIDKKTALDIKKDIYQLTKIVDKDIEDGKIQKIYFSKDWPLNGKIRFYPTFSITDWGTIKINEGYVPNNTSFCSEIGVSFINEKNEMKLVFHFNHVWVDGFEVAYFLNKFQQKVKDYNEPKN